MLSSIITSTCDQYKKLLRYYKCFSIKSDISVYFAFIAHLKCLKAIKVSGCHNIWQYKLKIDPHIYEHHR